jgi:hypothetical protein
VRLDHLLSKECFFVVIHVSGCDEAVLVGALSCQLLVIMVEALSLMVVEYQT